MIPAELSITPEAGSDTIIFSISVSKEAPRFMRMLKEVSVQLSGQNVAVNLEQIEARVKGSINRFAPLIQEELNHMYDLDAKLKKDVRQDKRLKFLFE